MEAKARQVPASQRTGRRTFDQTHQEDHALTVACPIAASGAASDSVNLIAWPQFGDRNPLQADFPVLIVKK
jgi:hypothetical protein